MNQPIFSRIPLNQIYRNLYPWRTFDEFFQQIKGTIAYRSPDNSLVALNKPFGVGIYTVQDQNASKQNTDRLLYRLSGQPKYCMKDILKPLSDEFGSAEPYQVLKGIDRYVSGLILITNDIKTVQRRFRKSITSARAQKKPPYGFRAITNGYPLIGSGKIYEKVGVELIEVDEFGDYKEPIIITKPGLNFGSKQDRATFQVEMELKKVNKELSVALIELYTSKLAWDFPRCYISSKTSFILGDVRFSKRIREILGKPIQVSAFKSSHRYDDSYEPLNQKLRKRLDIYKNASIPLMLDLHEMRLASFERKKDLLIKSSFVPAHFAATAEILELV